jgi:hypothetical protein
MPKQPQMGTIPVATTMIIKFVFVLTLYLFAKTRNIKHPMMEVMAVMKPCTTVCVAENEVISFWMYVCILLMAFTPSLNIKKAAQSIKIHACRAEFENYRASIKKGTDVSSIPYTHTQKKEGKRASLFEDGSITLML